ncbi:MAG: Ig-like domain-containing protein, partial [Clostridia bacterium]|nr:Ig-like domain-containing protein [Clostridia bacterium]
MKRLIKSLLIFAVTAVLGAVMAICAFAGNEDNWVCAWGTAPVQAQIDGLGEAGSIVGGLIGDDSLTEVTVRSVITPTASGSKIRIKFSNHYNTKPITINGVTVAKSIKESQIDMVSLKYLSFRDGYPSVTLAPGEEIYSDPISFDVVAHQKIAITTYVDSLLDVNTMGLSGADTYMTTGDALKVDDFDMLKEVLDDQDALDLMAKLLEGFGMGSSLNLKLAYSFVKFVPCLAGLDVLTHDLGYSVVVVGDSTVANDFPLYLGQALYEDEDVTSIGVAGKGIVGNCLLYPGLGVGSYLYAESLLQRFTRDVLSQSGVKYVVLKIGVNDIIHPVCTDSIVHYPGISQPSLDTLIRGYREIFKACHDAGVKVIVIGITQWKGATRDYFGDGGTYIRTPAEFEADWQLAKDVNNWLATTKEHDGYVDFCAVSANPLEPDALLPEYSEDCINPSAALQKVWANNFPLSLLGVGSMPGGVVMDKQTSSVYVGEQTQITATVYPETAEDKSLEWFSENPEIATVDENGVVTGLANGTAVISCRTVIGGFKASCKVTVSTKAETIILNYGTNTIFATETFNLKATVFPENATDKSVTYSTSNKSVASVNSQGKVTGVGAGTAIITCTSADGRIKAICNVTVKKKVHVQNIELRCEGEENYRSHTMFKNQAFELSYVISPAEATFKSV